MNRSTLNTVRKLLDRIDPSDGVCPACAAGAELVEVEAIAGQPPPEVPPVRRPCEAPATCRFTGVRQIVIMHYKPGNEPPDDDADGQDPDDGPLGGVEANETTATELAAI
jgi:hypothetical protein